ncbi:MAG TPA: hypothetical protein VFL47_07755 [Flavisolibacter sp.]|nr:hypothetical protein [Flavisolibacter sp.]
MEENKNKKTTTLNDGYMGTSENGNDVQNPITTASKSENSDNDVSTAQTRNPTDRSAGIGSKRFVSGTDLDGQVAP